MADVITRFKLETTQYDSKLRDASKSLAEYTRKATQAGNEFGKFTQKNVEAARALGNITPSATNAKDKVKELVGAFNDAAKAYNALTKEQQQSDFGKAMAASINQLSEKVKEAKNELYDLGGAIDKAGKGGGLFGGGKLDGMLQVLGGNLMTKGVSMLTSFGQEMANMVQQGVELAKQGEGIRIAFERLGRGDILDGLREATHGTVTDIELMKAAVKFNDFKLPVEELGTMLAFAQQKAKDTGQSVDYMVDSIVTGLGRKSLMILDNLGLSANEVKDKMKETGDMTKAVGEIIREQMAKAGDYVETAADRATQANVSLQNKMEELGRKFAPLEEASNNFWTSMKIGILDVIGGPLTNLLNRLTEAGRLMNAYGQIGGSGKVGRMIQNLSNAREENRQSIYQQQQAKIWDYINRRENYMKDRQRWVNGGGQNEDLRQSLIAQAKSFGTSNVNDIKAQIDAAKKMLSEYQQSAKQILSPVKADIDTKGAEQNVESLKVKLTELEAQRKKAIAAGDTDLSKSLAKQINQVKSDIKGLGGSTTTTKTHKATPQETATNKVTEAERTYAETLLKNSIRMETGLDTTLDYKKKELSAQERLFDAYNDAYATYKDPAYKKAATEAADKIRALAGEVKAETDAQEAAKKSARELESAQKKLADAQQKLAEAQSTGSATAIYQARKNVDKQQDVVNRLQNPKLPVTPQLTGFEAMKQSVQAEIKFDQMKVDETTLHSLLQTALKNGLDSVTVDYSGLQKRIANGIDIPDKTWIELQNEINAKLKELGLKPITIDIKTGNLEKMSNDAKVVTASFKDAASAVGNLGSALSGLDDPGAKIAGTVAQAVANIALAFSSADLKDGETGNVWYWIAATAAGLATMVSTISSIHAATNYAEGGMIKGNSYSGDNIGGLVDGSQFVGLNAGEVVLNAAQQSTLANNLQQAGGSLSVHGVLRGEDIVMVADRYGMRTGRGELAFWK